MRIKCSPLPHTGNPNTTHNRNQNRFNSRGLSVDIVGQLDVLWHNGYAFHVYSAQVGVFQEAGQVALSYLLQHHDCMHMEVQIDPPTILGYLPD